MLSLLSIFTWTGGWSFLIFEMGAAFLVFIMGGVKTKRGCIVIHFYDAASSCFSIGVGYFRVLFWGVGKITAGEKVLASVCSIQV